jgi:hypothetical protein
VFGLGFLNSIFLAAFSAALVPILIHILNRRRLRKIRFSSLEFIEELNKRRMSKINLRRWIILLLRTLAVVFLVSAFARPTLQSGLAMLIPGDAPRHVVICMDVSYSMGAEQEHGNAFTRAKQIAGQIIDDSSPGDPINVLAFSTRVNTLFESGTRNKQLVKSAIDKLEVTAEGTSVGRAILAGAEYIRSAEINTGEIYVISDFRTGGDSLGVIEEDKSIRVFYLPVENESIDNVSIDRIFTPRKLIRPGEVVRIGVGLTNHSLQHPAGFPLELWVGEKRKAEKFINLSPASSATVTFPVSLRQWGGYHCRIAKVRDRLTIDDDRFFFLEVSKSVPVTLVRGRKEVEPGRSAAFFYVDKALNPRSTADAEFKVSLVDETNLTASSFPVRGVVVWTDPQRMERNRLDLVKRYVRGGGSLMIFLGDQPRGFWEDRAFKQFLGIDSASLEEGTGGERVGSFQKDHPVFNIFSEEELELLSRSRVRSYAAVTGVAPDSVLAYFGSGDPALWEFKRGSGRVMVFAFSPSMTSGDLPLSPMFLPLIHTSVSYLADAEGTGFQRENVVGSDLHFDLAPQWKSQKAVLAGLSPAGGRNRALLYESPRGEFRAIIENPREVGFYRLLADSSLIAETPVNVDTKESNLNILPLEGDKLGSARVVDTAQEFGARLKEERQGREVYSFFLFLALAALGLEAILGRRA